MDEVQSTGGARGGLSRRELLKGAGGVAVGGALGACRASGDGPADAPENAALAGALRDASLVRLSINGAERAVLVEPRTTLLSALRHHLEPPLTGSKEVCDRGQCGACTVIVDGRPAYACMLLAARLEGREIRTVEGLGEPGRLSPVQQAFWEHDASMCGFCTPGFVVALTAALEKDPGAGGETLRAACAGNVCRCGTYPQVFAAAEAAGRRMRGEDE